MDKSKLITVKNKYSGVVGYTVPDLNIHRNFFPGESKDITYEELEKVSFDPGGAVVLKEYLEITDQEVANALLHTKPEPEYYYSEEDVKRIMKEGSLDQFLDCLDFAPSVIIDMIKTLAVEMPLNDVSKRDAIKNKFGFDVTRAIEVKNTKYDGETEAATEANASGRRAQPPKKEPSTPAATGRRYQAPKKDK